MLSGIALDCSPKVLDVIQLTVELRVEDALMACHLDDLGDQRLLGTEVLLKGHDLFRAAGSGVILAAFLASSPQPFLRPKTSFLEHYLEALGLSSKALVRMVVREHHGLRDAIESSRTHARLFPTGGEVHLVGKERVGSED